MSGQQQQVAARASGTPLVTGRQPATSVGVEAEEVGERPRPGWWQTTSTRTNTATISRVWNFTMRESARCGLAARAFSTKARKRASKTWRL